MQWKIEHSSLTWFNIAVGVCIVSSTSDRMVSNIMNYIATRYDAIPIKMMKIGASELARPISVIFNACIKEGKLLTEWKKWEWTPVFKRGDRCMKENYRPLTVLSCVDRVFEKMLAKQITINFEECLADGLTAYRKNNSCETSLVSLIELWRLVVDNITSPLSMYADDHQIYRRSKQGQTYILSPQN